MSTITVYGPDYVARHNLVRPRVNRWGRDCYYFSYNMVGEWCYAYPTSLDVVEVARIVDEMQDVVGLASIAGQTGYALFCLAHQLCFEDPASGRITGARHPGFIVLSGDTGALSLRDLVTHELSHELDRTLLTERDRDEFFAMLGQAKGSEYDAAWHKRPQERMAEYVSLALWGEPLRDSEMQTITPAQVALVREWALRKFGAQPRANVVIDGLARVVVTEGSNTAYVDGAPVRLDDDDPLVVADIARGRFRLPMAFITKVQRTGKEWNDRTRTGTFWIRT